MVVRKQNDPPPCIACCGVHVAGPRLCTAHYPTFPFPLQVDEVIRSHGKWISGGDDETLHAVRLSHPGLVLYPLQHEQLVEMKGEVNIGGAFLKAEVAFTDEEEEGQTL
jgi:hypothetical protein